MNLYILGDGMDMEIMKNDYLIDRRKKDIDKPMKLFQHFNNKEDQRRHEEYVKENVGNGTIEF